MQLAIKSNVSDHLPSIGFEGCAKIVQLHARKISHHPVGNAAGQSSSEPGIFSFHPPAADDIVAFRHFQKEMWNIFRVVLKVPIHGDDDVALGKVKSRLESCGLAEIPPQPNDAYAGVALVDLIQDRRCSIPTPVIDKDELVRLPYWIEHLDEACVKWPDILLLIVQRYDDRDGLR